MCLSNVAAPAVMFVRDAWTCSGSFVSLPGLPFLCYRWCRYHWGGGSSCGKSGEKLAHTRERRLARPRDPVHLGGGVGNGVIWMRAPDRHGRQNALLCNAPGETRPVQRVTLLPHSIPHLLQEAARGQRSGWSTPFTDRSHTRTFLALSKIRFFPSLLFLWLTTETDLG